MAEVNLRTSEGIRAFTAMNATQQREALQAPQGREAVITAAREMLARGDFRGVGQGNAGDDAARVQAVMLALNPDSNLRVDGRFGDARGGRRSQDALLRLQKQIDVNDGVAGANFLRAAVNRLERGEQVSAPPTPQRPERLTGAGLRSRATSSETAAQRSAAANEFAQRGADRQMQQRAAGAAGSEEGPRREEYNRIATDLRATPPEQRNGRADAVIRGLTGGENTEQGRGRVLDYLRTEGDHRDVLGRLQAGNQEQWNALRTQAAAPGGAEGLSPDTLRALAGTTSPTADGAERTTYRALRNAAIDRTQPGQLPAADMAYMLRENPANAGARLATERASNNPQVNGAVTGAVRDLVSNGRYAEAAAMVRQLHGELPPNARPGHLPPQTVAQARLASDAVLGVVTGDLTDDQRIGFYRALAAVPEGRTGPQGPNPIFATMPESQYQDFNRRVQASSTPSAGILSRQQTPRYIGDLAYVGVQRNLGLRLSEPAPPAR